MSLNHIVDQQYKQWLDPYVNSIKIDGEWSYKEANKVPGDNLVLDQDLVAQWEPVNTSVTPFGNAIAVKLQPQNLTATPTRISLSFLANFSPIFSFNTGDNYVTINQVGIYSIYVNLSYKTNVQLPVTIKLTTNESTDIPGSSVSSFAGSVVFGPLGGYIQEMNVYTNCLVNITATGTRINVVGSGSTSLIPIDTALSTMTILRLG